MDGICYKFYEKGLEKVENLPLQQWMESSMKDYFDERVDFLKEADLSKSIQLMFIHAIIMVVWL